MKFVSLLTCCIFCCCSLLKAQKTEISFEVFYKGKSIGTVTATQNKKGTASEKNLTAKTDTKVIMISVHVESEVHVIKENEILVEGTAYRHANRGSADVHAHVKKIGNKQYQRERNGKKTSLQNKDIGFCVVDLYFNEPKGLTTIFSNMYADYLTVKPMGNGKYGIITPDDKNTYYTYQNGKLMMIEADTPVGSVVSKRK